MRTIKFRFWDYGLKKMCFRNPATMDFSHPKILPMQFTGLQDKNGKEIYEGDVLSDYTETDEGLIQSKYPVYWGEKEGQWVVDQSYNKDRTCPATLAWELEMFEYEITGNIHETPELL